MNAKMNEIDHIKKKWDDAIENADHDSLVDLGRKAIHLGEIYREIAIKNHIGYAFEPDPPSEFIDKSATEKFNAKEKK